MTYKSVAEIREMYSLLIAQRVEHERAIELLGSDHPASVEVLEEKIADINLLLDDLDDQEFELTGSPGWVNFANELAEKKKIEGAA